MSNSDKHNHSEKITLVLVDDSRSFQLALEHYLSELSDFSFVAKAGSGQEALRLPDSLLPDIVLLDWQLPDRSGLTLIAPLREKWPQTKVIVLTFADGPQHRAAALAAGATNFVSKISAVDDLVPAMIEAMESSSNSGGSA